MRVLHVSQPVEAGVPAVVLALATDQLERGYEVHVACPPGPGLADELPGEAVHHAWHAERSPGRSVPSEVRRLRAIVDAIAPDVVVLHSAKAGLAGRLAVRGRIPTVFVPHAWSFEAVDGLLEVASRRWEAAASRFTAVTVCVSADEQRRGEAEGVAGPYEVIANGVDTEVWRPRERAAARAELGLDAAPTVVCVGRLAEQKGQDMLLAAWRAVRAEVPGARLLLAGDGPLRPEIEAAAAGLEGVELLGARRDVARLFAAADVVALPSRWESTPLVSLEAMASGRPVVAFEVDGVRDTFGPTGTILDQGDVVGFGRALVRLLDTPALAEAEGRSARERICEVGDLRNNLKQWDSLLTGLIAAPETVPTDEPPVSVVMTVLNEGTDLDRVVDLLLPQLRPDDELVVCDGGSTDGSVARLRGRAQVRVEVVPGAGISAGRNHAIRAARHVVVVCTDAGCLPAPGFVDAFRRAFAVSPAPALAAGVYRPIARNALERAQALACYPQPDEVDPPAPVRAYTRVFGTGYDPALAVGRCVAFTKQAWSAVGGFPENLATGEDVAFAQACARLGAAVAVPDALVDWVQRGSVAATWRMYRGYGRASTGGGGGGMLVRDTVRGLAYLAVPLLAASRVGRVAAVAGGVAYLSLPVARALRAKAGPKAVALLPVAMAVKDLGKLAGAAQGIRRGAS